MGYLSGKPTSNEKSTHLLKDVVLVPTWLIAKALEKHFPEGHLWRNNVPNFRDWCDGASDLCIDFGIGMTMSWSWMILCLYIIIF